MENKIVMDTSRGFSSLAEKDMHDWIILHKEEAIKWFNSLSNYRLLQSNKKKLINRAKPTMYLFPSVQVRDDRRL